jgi:hypothetical protein
VPHRTCVKCKKAENPLGRLRFKKSRLDGKVYCENCDPVGQDVTVEPVVHAPPASSSSSKPRPPSAGLVVVNCPDCAGGVHRPHSKPCQGCAGYGAVRIEAAMLNVYRPKPIPAPELLTEG